MTREEFQSYLNIVFVSLKDEAYGKDDKLPAKDKGLLLDVCKIVKYDKPNGKSAFDKAYKNNIEPVIKNWRVNMSQNQSSPYLLRQVLYYFCETAYRDEVKEYQQTELINEIGKVWYTMPTKGKNKDKKIPISQNVWNKWEMYPKKLYRVLFEEQPKRIYPYKGGKTDAIGLGVRYLAFQAGAYSDFIDIFGGSGFATASVIHTQGTKYFYNELNRHVRNLFEVLADDKLCKEYIRAMKDFLYDLRHKVQERSVFKNVNLDADGYNAYSSKIRQLSSLEREIQGYNDGFIMSDAQIARAVDTINENEKFAQGGTCYCYDKAYSCANILKLLNKTDIQSTENQVVVEEYCHSVYAIFPKEVITGSYKNSGNKVCLTYYLGNLENYYALGYWFYFQVLLKTPKKINKTEKVKYAIASTYLLSMAVNGIDVETNSEVLYTTDGLYATKSSGRQHSTDKYRDFVDRANKKDVEVFKSFERKVKAFHKTIQDVNISGFDAIDLVKNYQRRLGLRYQNKKQDEVLFYSDSPYEGTSDYEDLANGVKNFTADNMADLIQALLDSGQKFIFSCRASTTGKLSDEKRAKNHEILENVFEFFRDKATKTLYVTAIVDRNTKEETEYFSSADKMSRFVDSVKKNKGTEIYITNYKVRDFYSKQFNTDYYVMDFDTFMKIEKENLQV